MEDNTNDTTKAADELEPVKVKDSWYLMKDAKGYGSVSVTLVLVSFFVTTAAYILSMFEHIGPVTMRSFDIGASSSYFIPILTLYFGRRFTDAKFFGDK